MSNIVGKLVAAMNEGGIDWNSLSRVRGYSPIDLYYEVSSVHKYSEGERFAISRERLYVFPIETVKCVKRIKELSKFYKGDED